MEKRYFEINGEDKTKINQNKYTLSTIFKCH